MLKKLLVLAAVLLISAVLAVPAFAQTTEETSDLGGIFSADSCPVLQQDPTVYDLVVSMFPSLAETCGTTEPV